MRPSQTFAAAGFGLGMVALGMTAPWLERTVLSLLLWGLFSAGVWLRSAAAIASDTPRAEEALSDADLPVYTIIVAMYREGSVAPKLVAALDRH
jgi:glycosyltransferase XagB